MELAKMRSYLFLVVLAAVSIFFFFIIKPLIFPIFWAAIFATLFYPFYKGIRKRLKNENLSASIALILITLIILLPLILIGTLMVKEILNIYLSINDNQGAVGGFLSNLGENLKNSAIVQRLHINDAVITQQLNDIGRGLVTYIYNLAKSVTQNSLAFLGLFVLMLYTLFFFLRDGEKILKKVMYLFPFGDRYEKLLYEKFSSTASATIKGTIIVGAIQGMLGGLLFFATGIPSALIWGLAMAVFAAIPVTGTAVVWLPAGLIELLTGHIWQGLVILLFGLLVVSTVDNVIKPLLVGKDLQMHPVVVLFSTLGGIIVFGLSGFVLGPIVAALCQSFWEIYENYYHDELMKN